MSETDLYTFASKLKLKHFRGVFMRDTLPSNCRVKECGILNLDSVEGPGTHWTCWYKKSNKKCYYFDSFGLTSPSEFDNYVKCNIISSTYKIQNIDDIICGHLCLIVLYEMCYSKLSFHSIVFNIFSL